MCYLFISLFLLVCKFVINTKGKKIKKKKKKKKIFTFFIGNDLISSDQSGFEPGNPYINQLFPKTHESWKSFRGGYEVKGAFLGISKAFGKVWHDSVMLKLQQNRLPDQLCDISQDVLDNQK